MSEPKIFSFSPGHQKVCIGACVVGLFVLGLGFSGVIGSPMRTWANFLLNAVYFLGLSVFATFFVALHYLTGARWSEVIRKVPEAVSRFIPVGSGLLLVSLIGASSLYSWMHGDHGSLHGDKHLYLNLPFFALRMVAVTGIWWLFSKRFLRLSRDQDQGVFPRGLLKTAAVFMIVFALSFAVATYDWIMSLEPHWFSTVFSVYHFSGVFVTGTALLAIIVIVLQDMKVLREVNENHIHDLGKYLFAFSMFWAYIWYCQFMLIWYGNIPEETVYYAARLKDDWSWLFYFNFFLNFVVPFSVLLSRSAKRSSAIVLRVAIVVMVGHWLDLYLMIMPPVTGAASNIGMLEISTTVGFLGVFTLVVGRALGRSPMLPQRSAILAESLHHHQ